MARGKFITFEGGEGTGKSTQAKRLAAALEARGYRVVLTREPGGSPGAEEIRKLLVEGPPDRWSAIAETLLFLAARVDHLEKTIEPALQEGAWVVCDRFLDSTVVYQGEARFVNGQYDAAGVERVQKLQAIALSGKSLPELTFMLDVPDGIGLVRAHARGPGYGTRFEQFGPLFHRYVRQAFLDIGKREHELGQNRYKIIDGSRDPDAVAAEIWRVVKESFKI